MPLRYGTVVRLALEELSVLGVGQPPEQAVLDSGIQRLSLLLDNLSLAGTEQPRRVSVSHVFTDSKTSYTIGASQDIDVVLPADIDLVTYESAINDLEPYPLERVSLDAIIRRRNIDAETGPSSYQSEWAVPATIRFDRPSQVGGSLVIWGRSYIGPEEVNASTMLELPRGSERHIVLALAFELAPSHGVAISQEALRNMREAKSQLLTRNYEIPTPRYDPMFLQGNMRYNRQDYNDVGQR